MRETTFQAICYSDVLWNARVFNTGYLERLQSCAYIQRLPQLDKCKISLN